MRKIIILFSVLSIVFVLIFTDPAYCQNKLLIIDFDCRGKAAGQSNAFGQTLRKELSKEGGSLVSREAFERLLRRKNLDESDLNYTFDQLKGAASELNADAAVFGHIYSTEEMIIIEVRYWAIREPGPILFDPIVCGSVEDVFAVIPDIAAMILSPDKTAPQIISVVPSDGQTGVDQFVDMKITFSEPMNPSTISITAKPENMWQKFGRVIYNGKLNEFTIKVHLYPDTRYEFQVNGSDSKGFKDLAGNPAPRYRWSFSTSR